MTSPIVGAPSSIESVMHVILFVVSGNLSLYLTNEEYRSFISSPEISKAPISMIAELAMSRPVVSISSTMYSIHILAYKSHYTLGCMDFQQNCPCKKHCW